VHREHADDAENRLIRVRAVDALGAACDIGLTFTTGGDAEWFAQTREYDVACPELVERDSDVIRGHL